MSQMEDDTRTNAIVGTTAVDYDHTLGGHPKHHVPVSNDLMDTAVPDEDQQARALGALQVAALSGFVEYVGSTQESCLCLCNTFREHVPVDCLRIRRGVPPSILAIFCPGLQEAESYHSSRVSPHRIVLKVHWTFDDSPAYGIFVEETEEAEGEGRIVHTRGTGPTADVNVDMNKVRWPEGTKEIALCSLICSIDAFTLPVGLERFWFGHAITLAKLVGIPDNFRMSLDRVIFPGGLLEIFLGNSFNEPIEGIAFPKGLERLSLPGFNQSIRDVEWPPGLKALEFVSPSTIQLWTEWGWKGPGGYAGPDHYVADQPFAEDIHEGYGRFNQPLGTTLPPSLETLWLSSKFRQPLNGVSWPSGILTIGLAFDLRGYRYTESMAWPSSLQFLFLVNRPCERIIYRQGSKVSFLLTHGEGISNPYTACCYNRAEDMSDIVCDDYASSDSDY